MISVTKRLALTAIVTLAVSAMAVSGAQAAFEFTATNDGVHETANLTGAETARHQLNLGTSFGGIICTTSTFTGHMEIGATKELTATPIFSGCNESFGNPVTINTEGCEYRFHITSALNGDEYEGTTSVVNCLKSGIRLTFANFGGSCTILIGEQTADSSVTYTNKTNTPAALNDLEVDENLTNVKSTTSGGGCFTSSGEHTGVYTGRTTVTAKNLNAVPIEPSVSG